MAVAPSTIRVQPDSTGKYVDNVEVDTGLLGVGVVERQVISVADPETPEARTKVTAATPAAGDYGLTVKAEALGAQADAEAAGNGSIIALLKRLRTLLSGSLAVTGTFWQATQPVSGPVTDVQLRATAVPVSGPLTDVQLRATAVPVSGTVTTAGLTDAQLRAAAVPVSGPLTDTQLRAAAVPVSGTVSTGGLTDAQLRAAAVPVSGPLTDTQLRAAALPVSGTFFQGTQPVSGPLTDAQLRASAVPVSGPLTDAQLRALAVAVSGTFWQGTQPVSGTFFQATQPVSVAATVATAETRPTTGTHSNVSGTGASVQLAASNANRRGLTVQNDAGVVAYVKLGTSASASSFTVKMVDQAYYEAPQPCYTGVVEALWASGALRVVELT